MAAASLTVTFRTNGKVHAINGYASDASNVAVKLDPAKVAVAGSPDYWQTPAAGHLTDVVFTSDLATPTHIQVTRNGQPTGDVLDVTANLASVVSRPHMAIPFNQGDKLGLTQIA